MQHRFLDRVKRLPSLGIGVSTEFGALSATEHLDISALRSEYPQFAQFLEVGVETTKGIDRDTVDWVKANRPTTYHFLDANLSRTDSFDEYWLNSVEGYIEQLNPAWVCGDAGLWHFGRRHPLQMTLLPPVLTCESARAYGQGIKHLRARLRREVFPENPPGVLFLGQLDLLDFFAKVIEESDTGFLLDAAHLAIYQSLKGREPLDGLTDFPLDRIVEIHVAGSSLKQIEGFTYWSDDHQPNVRSETWQIVEFLADRASNLKAVVFECERNTLKTTLPGFSRIAEIFPSLATLNRDADDLSVPHREAETPIDVETMGRDFASTLERAGVQRAEHMQVLSLHDPYFLEALNGDRKFPVDLGGYATELAHLRTFDPRLFRSDKLRAERVLTGLIDRFPMTLWSVMSVDLFSRLRAYFSSPAFYRVVLENDFVHRGFARFLQRNYDVPEDWLQVELAFEDTKSRRANGDFAIGMLCSSPQIKVVHCRSSRLEIFLRYRSQIEAAGKSAAEFLLMREKLRLPCPTEGSDESAVPFLIEDHGESRISEITKGLAMLLDFCASQRTQAQVEAFMSEHGVEPTECRELLTEFLADGLFLGQLFTPAI